MRESTRTEIMDAVETVEEDIQPLELRSDTASSLAMHFKVADAQIAILAKDYMALTCDPSDKKAFEVVHSARMDVADLRIQVDKTRKGLVEDSVKWQKTVNGEAKRITSLLAPIEAHLKAEEAIYTAEQDRIKAERQREAQARIQLRIDALAAVGVKANLAEIALMPEEAFSRHLQLETEAFNRAEAVRAQEEAEKARKEREEVDRLAKIREAQEAEQKRLEAVAAEQAKQAAELKAEREAMDAEKNRQAQAAREEQIRKDAEAKATAEAARKAEEDKARQEQAEKAKIADQERKAKEEAERLQVAKAKAVAVEAARPDADKLEVYSQMLESVTPAEMSTDAGRAARITIMDAHARFLAFIRAKAEGLTK